MKKILFLLATAVVLGCNNPNEVETQILLETSTFFKEVGKIGPLRELEYNDEALKVIAEQQNSLKSIKEKYEHLINEHATDIYKEKFDTLVDSYGGMIKLGRTMEVVKKELEGK